MTTDGNILDTPTRATVAAMIDHTLLAPEATTAQVVEAIAEAVDLGVVAVCLSPGVLPVRAPESLVVATVAGFPSGKHHSLIKGSEARLAVDSGAAEVDMVIDIGAALERDMSAVLADIVTVREAIGGSAVLKVILESAVLLSAPGGADLLAECCVTAERAGADYVKTSTGFHPAGGASVEAVRIMAETVGGRLGVKASGGIRDAETAAAMIAAGATRLGLSRSREVLDGFPA